MDKDEELVNLAYLNGLLKGKKEQVNNMINLFVEYTPPAIREIKELVDKHEWSTVKEKVHAIKSYYSYMGNELLDRKIIEWESQLTAGNNNDFDHTAVVNELQNTTALIVEKLKQIVLSEGQ